MKLINKFVASMLILIFIFIAKPCSFAKEKSGNISDEQIKLMFSLEIIDPFKDGSIKPEMKVSRADMAVYIAKILGYTQQHKSTLIDFSDVGKDYWAYNEIMFVSEQKIMKGYTDGTFLPDNSISVDEALKCMLQITGYDTLAEAKGGYPVGYRIVGKQYKFLTKVELTKEATRAEIVPLIFNTLNINFYEPTAFENENVKYEISDTNLLYRNFALKRVEGIINSNEYVNLFGNERADKGFVQVNRVNYLEGNSVASKFIGSVCAIYVKNYEDANREIVIAQPLSPNEQFEVPIKDLQTLYNNGCLEYVLNGEMKTKQLANEAILIYNNGYMGLIKNHYSQIAKPKLGNISLKDIDSDGKYDYIFVEDYKSYVIEKVDSYSEKIFFKYGRLFEEKSFIDLNSQNSNCNISMLSNDKKINFSHLKINGVVSIAKSTDGKSVKILYSTAKADGKIEGIEESKGKKLLINQHWYEISPVYTDAINDNFRGISKLEFGDYVEILLDSFDCIAGAKLSDNSRATYAFLRSVNKTEKFTKDVFLKIFTENGTWITPKVADVVFLNGEDNKNVDDVWNAITQNDNVVNQMIRYKLNLNNEIIYLDTEEKNPIYEEGELKKELEWEEYVDWQLGWNLKGTSFKIYDNTLLFLIPNDLETAKDDYFSVATKKQAFLEGHKYTIDLYNADRFLRCKMAVVKTGGKSNTYDDRNYILADKFKQGLDDEETPVKILQGYNGKSISAGIGEVTYQDFAALDSVTYDDVVSGDVLQYAMSNKKVKAVNKVFGIDKLDSPYFIKNAGAKDEQGYGVICDVDYQDGMVLIDINGAFYSYQLRAIALYNLENEKPRTATVNDIEIGDKVFFIGNYSTPGYTIIYR